MKYINKGEILSVEQLMGYLKNHKDSLLTSDWLGLVEITNANGQPTQFSCQSQAWSSACLIEAIFKYSENYKNV